MRKTNIKVSVIVPVYNVAPYLAQCLDSLVGQSLDDIEIICVDDKSTDESLEILHQYRDKYPQITVIELDKNSGVSTARNTGMNAACGEYLGFVDSDDYVDLDFYEKLYNTARATGADIVKANAHITECDGHTRFDDEHIAAIRMFGKWRFEYQWWTGLYSHRLISENKITFPTDIKNGEDCVFLTNCVFYANMVATCSNTYYYYSRRDFSLDEAFLSPEMLKNRIKSISLICDIYNKATILADEYMFCYLDKFNQCKDLMLRNTSLLAKKHVADAMIEIYDKCNFKGIFIKQLLKKYPESESYINFLRSYDSAGLTSYFQDKTKSTIVKSPRQYKVLLFSILPALTIKNKTTGLQVRIFGIQILKVKHGAKNTRLNILGVPVLRVKEK